MIDPNEPVREPGNLRLLRILVTVLMAVMIAGFIVIVVLFVMRFPSPGSTSGPILTLPDDITLPDGAQAESFTVGRDWLGIVTGDNRILIYDRATGKLRQTLTVN